MTPVSKPRASDVDGSCYKMLRVSHGIPKDRITEVGSYYVTGNERGKRKKNQIRVVSGKITFIFHIETSFVDLQKTIML